MFKIECCGRLVRLSAGSCFITVPPYHERFTPNHGSTNRLLRIHSSRFLARVWARTVVFQHSTCEHVTLYRRVVKYMYKKTYLSFRIITSRPLCQIKQGDQTKLFSTLKKCENRVVEKTISLNVSLQLEPNNIFVFTYTNLGLTGDYSSATNASKYRPSG